MTTHILAAVPSGTATNTSFGGSIGFEFTVSENIWITELGCYIAPGGTLANDQVAVLANVAALSTALATATIPAGTAATVGQMGFASLATALEVVPGQTYCCWVPGYTGQNNAYFNATTGSQLTTDTDGGVVTGLGSVYSSNPATPPPSSSLNASVPFGVGVNTFGYQDTAPPSGSLSPTSLTAIDRATDAAITPTFAGGTGVLALTGLGLLSTTSPTSGTPVYYRPPISSFLAGTSTITLTVGGVTVATCVITYAPPLATLAAPVLCQVADGIATTVAAPGRGIGANTVTVASIAGFPTPTTSAPVRLTVVRSGAWLLNLFATGLSGTTFSGVTVADGGTDVALVVGDAIGLNATAGMVADLNAAVQTNVTTINSLIGLADALPSLNAAGLNTVLAGPSSGYATPPTMRALVAADIPSLSYDAAGAAAAAQAASSPLAGSTSLVTTGTITAGTWHGSTIAVAYLGSGTPSAGKYLDGGGTWTTLTSYTAGTGLTLATGQFSVNTTQAISVRTCTVTTDTYASTVTLNFASSDFHTLTLTGNPTLAFSGASVGQVIRIELIQDATGSRTVTWPTVRWTAATAPVLTTTASKADLVVIVVRSDGTFTGSASIQNY